MVFSYFNTEELENLKKGEFIIRERKIPQRPWPEVTVYKFIRAYPLTAISLLSDYEKQTNYIKNLKKAKIVKFIKKNHSHVDFEMKIPFPLKDSVYRTGNVIDFLGSELYRLSWYQVSSNTTRESKGFALFVPFYNGTLLKYRSYIYPKSSLAGLFKGNFVKTLVRDVKSIVSYIEAKKSDKKLLGKEIFRLIKATGRD